MIDKTKHQKSKNFIYIYIYIYNFEKSHDKNLFRLLNLF